MNIFRRMAVAGLIAGAWMASSSAWADTVYLKDGREVEGTVVEDNANTVAVKLASGATKSFRRADVDTVVYSRREKREPKLVEAPPAEKPADPKAGDTKTAAKDDTKDPKAKDGKKDGKDGKTDEKTAEGEEKDDWSPPPGLSNFPDRAKRMSPEKEKAFMAALEKFDSEDEAKRTEAKAELAALGAEALPYFVAGIWHSNVSARTACMNLVGQMNGRFAIKHVIEVFYAAMPEEGRAATYQVPFIRAIMTTLPGISGQTFISVEAKSELVQDGLKKYIEWYNSNFDRLPPQLGEKKIEATDPEYTEKLKKARALELKKKSWPRPPMPADMAAGTSKDGSPPKPAMPPGAGERPIDQAYKDTYKKVDREDALKRPQDK
ncbi:MAG TPA: hypothetical protein VEJ63_20475 [Planctomycetota bacterium]|nr:hypothetical protein [Planctomycetota bacterium]